VTPCRAIRRRHGLGPEEKRLARYSVPYGKESITFELPDRYRVETVRPQPAKPVDEPVRAVEDALASPRELEGERFRTARSAAIAINDKTRPVPHYALLPPLLRWLEEQGIPRSGITLIVATGTHAPMQPEEFPDIVPKEILDAYRVVSHDAFDKERLVHMGDTGRGNAVYVNGEYVAADIRVVVGNIEPHQFMGYSGGAKSACIGLAGYETITRNHAMMNEEHARLGEFAENPPRQEVEEMSGLLRVDLALNAVLNEQKKIVKVFAGEPSAVMRAGIPAVESMYRVSVAKPFDLVITSPGGAPKDINLYQAQKGLAHAALAAKPQAPIVLVARCLEGTGSDSYEEWVRNLHSNQEVLEEFARQGFRLGRHKAFQIARDSVTRRVFLLSDMDPGRVRKLLLEPVGRIKEALSAVAEALPEEPRVGIFPIANATMPAVEQMPQ
jgi:nickel-dependent lactate racemase